MATLIALGTIGVAALAAWTPACRSAAPIHRSYCGATKLGGSAQPQPIMVQKRRHAKIVSKQRECFMLIATS